MTTEEQERTAYTNGDAHTAALLARIADVEHINEGIAGAIVHIEESKTGVPGEDCLSDLLHHARMMATGRITKAEMLAFVELIEEHQNQLAQSAEYAHDELRQALECLK
jgi:hypothetical protein